MQSIDPFPRLIVIADFDYLGEEIKWLNLLDVLENHSEAGKFAIQIRLKSHSAHDYSSLADSARTVLETSSFAILNGSINTAERLTYWGVHLSTESLTSTSELSTTLPFVAASVHNHVELNHASELGVSAVVCAPVYPTGWKQSKPLGLKGLSQLTSRCSVPAFGLGGITPEKCAACFQAGCYGVAVLSYVLGNKNHADALSRLIEHCYANC